MSLYLTSLYVFMSESVTLFVVFSICIIYTICYYFFIRLPTIPMKILRTSLKIPQISLTRMSWIHRVNWHLWVAESSQRRYLLQKPHALQLPPRRPLARSLLLLPLASRRHYPTIRTLQKNVLSRPDRLRTGCQYRRRLRYLCYITSAIVYLFIIYYLPVYIILGNHFD